MKRALVILIIAAMGLSGCATTWVSKGGWSGNAPQTPENYAAAAAFDLVTSPVQAIGLILITPELIKDATAGKQSKPANESPKTPEPKPQSALQEYSHADS